MANNNPFMPTPGATAPAPTSTPMPGNTHAPNGADSFEVDLTEVQNVVDVTFGDYKKKIENGFTIPDGNYRLKCIDIEQQVSKGGNPMFVWTLEVSAGQHTGFQGKVFTAITPAAMWKVAETVKAFGVGQEGQMVKFKRSDVVGKECGGYIEKTEYNGQERSQIQRVFTMQELAEAQNQ